MEGTQSLQFWSIFGPIYPRETKNIGKSQNFRRNYILRTIRLCKSQFPDKSHNCYHKKTPILSAQNVLFKVRNRPIIKDQDVRRPVITTFSESPNPGLTADARIFFFTAGLELFHF